MAIILRTLSATKRARIGDAVGLQAVFIMLGGLRSIMRRRCVIRTQSGYVPTGDLTDQPQRSLSHCWRGSRAYTRHGTEEAVEARC